MEPASIRNIIFDLGGVVLNIDFTRVAKAFEEIGLHDFNNFYSRVNQHNLFEDFEKGVITPGEFRDQLRQISGLDISDQEIDQAWNAILLDIPVNRIKLLEKLKVKYRTFMLSNTNAIHYEVYNRDLYVNSGHKNLSALFEKAYFSHKLGMRKPSFEIFRYVLVRNHLQPEETLFIDDSLQHVLAARQLGLGTYLLPAGKDMTEVFEKDTLMFLPPLFV